MPKLFSLFSLLAILSVSVPHRASAAKDLQGAPAKELLKSCASHTERRYNTTSTATQRTQCLAFFYGVASALLWQQANGQATGLCLPDDLSVDQAVQIFREWMQQNPQAGENFMTDAVMQSLAAQYPCKE